MKTQFFFLLGFGHESPHLECMNPFIVECHEKFKLFFARCCQVHGVFFSFLSPRSYFSLSQSLYPVLSGRSFILLLNTLSVQLCIFWLICQNARSDRHTFTSSRLRNRRPSSTLTSTPRRRSLPSPTSTSGKHSLLM